MKYPVALNAVLCFCLTASVDQPPAPIEYKERGMTVSNSTNITDNDEGVISRSSMEETPKTEKVSRVLEEPKINIIEEDLDIIEIPTTQDEDETLENHEQDEQIAKLNFAKPLAGEIVMKFEAGKNKGIDIAVNEKSSVNSIATGTIIYSGFNKQFGNLVIVKLDKDDLEVAYANLKDLLVKKGHKIAEGGLVGHVEDKLYLAMRKGKVAVDPGKYVEF